MKMEVVHIDKIVPGNRARKDMGDLQALADSIETTGLLQPIVVDHQLKLINGERRIRAHVLLGRDTIPAWVVNVPSLLVAEFAENEIRKQFTYTERASLAEAIEEEEKSRAKERQRESGEKFGKGIGPDQLDLTYKKGQARDFIAQRAGFSSVGTYERVKRAARDAIPEVLHELDLENITPYKAASISRLPKDQQLAALNGEIPIATEPAKKDKPSNLNPVAQGHQFVSRGNPSVFNDPEYPNSVTFLTTKMMGMFMTMERTIRVDPVALEKLRMIRNECDRLIEDIQSWRSK